jgi:hypothetical protein
MTEEKSNVVVHPVTAKEFAGIAYDVKEPVAYRVYCTNNGATGYLYTEVLPFEPGPGVHVRREPEPLYTMSSTHQNTPGGKL